MFPSDVTAAHYLAGLIDGEGSVTMRPFKTRGGTQGYARDVRITNTDLDIIEAAEEALDRLGIPYHRYLRTDRAEQPNVYGSKPLMDVVVSHRDGLREVLARVPLRCSRKRAKLEEAVGSYTNYGRLPDRDELVRVYMKRGDRGAAEHFGVSSGTIYNWRQKLGIAAARQRGRPRAVPASE